MKNWEQPKRPFFLLARRPPFLLRPTFSLLSLPPLSPEKQRWRRPRGASLPPSAAPSSGPGQQRGSAARKKTSLTAVYNRKREREEREEVRKRLNDQSK